MMDCTGTCHHSPNNQTGKRSNKATDFSVVWNLTCAEFTNYSHKQCKANSGKECQDFRGVTMVVDINIMQWLKDSYA